MRVSLMFGCRRDPSGVTLTDLEDGRIRLTATAAGTYKLYEHYYDEELGEEVSFAFPLTVTVRDRSGGGSYSGGGPGGDSRPSSAASAGGTATEANADVPGGCWAASSIDFVTSRGLFNGTGASTFAPGPGTARTQLMTALARLDGADTSGSALEKGMAWAVAQGISDGTDPGAQVTRQQLAVMLWRYAGSPAASQELSHGDAGPDGRDDDPLCEGRQRMTSPAAPAVPRKTGAAPAKPGRPSRAGGGLGP